MSEARRYSADHRDLDAIVRQNASSQRPLVESRDGIEAMENACQPTTGYPAGCQDARTRAIERVGFVSTLGVDLSFDPSPPTAPLAPPQGFPRYPASGASSAVNNRRIASLPHLTRWDGGENSVPRRDHHHPAARNVAGKRRGNQMS
jgi:hypothetical protein